MFSSCLYLIFSRSKGCKIQVDMTPPLTPANKCSYLTPDRKLNFSLEVLGFDDMVVIFTIYLQIKCPITIHMWKIIALASLQEFCLEKLKQCFITCFTTISLNNLCWSRFGLTDRFASLPRIGQKCQFIL